MAHELYRIPLRAPSEEQITKEQLEQLKGNHAFRSFITYLADTIAHERDLFETTVANEYQRGRLNALTDLYKLLS